MAPWDSPPHPTGHFLHVLLKGKRNWETKRLAQYKKIQGLSGQVRPWYQEGRGYRTQVGMARA